MPLPLADWTERQYVSKFATDPLSLLIYGNGAPRDVDANLMTVTMQPSVPYATPAPVVPTRIFERVAAHTDTGTYSTSLQSAETEAPGAYDIIWGYSIDGIPQSYTTYILVGESAPAYDQLAPDLKDVVDRVWLRFADTFDSVYGGPNLQDYFQSHFGRGRIAQLLRIVLGQLSVRINPPLQSAWTADPGGHQFPTAQWGYILEQSLYIETIKHLIRSYTEQPSADGVGVARLDRRDYAQRWESILDMEQRSFEDGFSIMRISFMNLGRPHVLVSGGVYGSYAPTRISSSAAARPRYWSRFY